MWVNAPCGLWEESSTRQQVLLVYIFSITIGDSMLILYQRLYSKTQKGDTLSALAKVIRYQKVLSISS